MDINLILGGLALVEVIIITFSTWIVVSIFSMKQDIALNGKSDDLMSDKVSELAGKIDSLTSLVTEIKETLLVSQIMKK